VARRRARVYGAAAVHGRTCLLVGMLVLLLAAPAWAGTLSVTFSSGAGEVWHDPGPWCSAAQAPCTSAITEDEHVSIQTYWPPGWQFTGWVGPCVDPQSSTCDFVAPAGDVSVVAKIEDAGDPLTYVEVTESDAGLTRWDQLGVTGRDDQTGLTRLRLLAGQLVVGDWAVDAGPGELVTRTHTPSAAPPPDGDVQLVAEATDKAGRVATSARWVSLDATRPAVELLDVSALRAPRGLREFIADRGTLTARFRVADAHLDASTLRCSYDGVNVGCPLGDDGTVAVSVPAGNPELHSLFVSVRDTAGNPGSRILRILVDDGPARVTFAGGTPEGARLLPEPFMAPGREYVSAGWQLAISELTDIQVECRAWFDGQRDPIEAFHSCGGGRIRAGIFTVAQRFRTGRWTIEIQVRDVLGHLTSVPARHFVITGSPGTRFLKPAVTGAFPAAGAGFRARIRATRLPGNAVAELRCDGAGCPIKRLRIPVRHGRADATRLVGRKRFHPGQRVELRLKAARRIGRVISWSLGAPGVSPLRHDLCLAPGAWTPRGCWD
jgi:hypothetical protein